MAEQISSTALPPRMKLQESVLQSFEKGLETESPSKRRRAFWEGICIPDRQKQVVRPSGPEDRAFKGTGELFQPVLILLRKASKNRTVNIQHACHITGLSVMQYDDQLGI